MKQKCFFLAYSLNNSSLADYFVDLSNQFYQSGYKVVVVSDKRGYQTQLHGSVIVRYWPSKRPTGIKDFLFLLRLINEFKPQVMISIFGAVNVFLLTGVIKRVPHRVAWIRSVSSHFGLNKFLAYRKSLFYKLSTCIICNSQATKEDAITTFKVRESKIQILPNSIRGNFTGVVKKNYNQVVYVGRLYRAKGIEDLIRAFQLVNDKYKESKLYIIGQGPHEEFLKNLKNQLGLQNDVEFLGFLSKQEVLQWFANSAIAVVPSHSEAFGYTVIEAMSVKTCVIGANNTGIKEIIVHNETGFLFETKNSEDLAQKIISVIENRELCDKLAMKGYERFKEHYESKKAIIRDYNFFNKLIEEC
ncbi:MAG: glycosyltransferase family 4 protein [Flavobacteriaceae bacterium]|jgi:glycosyltransferase involved in cell wall biosynthesis|nr:glycosyltransferase family 4 protein [Flavobacteriaceae bacterium]